MDAERAAQIYGRRILVCGHWATQAWKDIPSELDLLARSPARAAPLSGNRLLSVLFHHGIVGDNRMALSNDAQIAMETGHDDRRSQHRYRRH
jgi:hypothetical protein